MSKLKDEVQKKIKYYQGQQENIISQYLVSNKRTDRDRLIKCREKLAVYNEILTLKEN